MGTLTDAGLLVFGLVLGWFQYRRALSSAWSRVGPEVTKQTSYREVAQSVPIAGASRFVRLLVAYVSTLGYFGAARVGWGWVGMQDIYDHGHRISDLVPKDASAIYLQIAIAVQGAAMFVLVPRAARAFAYRRPEMSRAHGRALAVTAVGLVVAVLDFVVLYRSTSKPPIYWMQTMLMDDVTFGLLSFVGLGAIVLLRRAEKDAPPVADAAVTAEARGTRNRVGAIEIVIALASIATMAHAFVYAHHRYRVSRENDGEIEVSSAGNPIESSDHTFMYWMPEGTFIYPREKETPVGKVKTTWYFFSSHNLLLVLEYWERPASDLRTLAEMCPPPGIIKSESTCETVDRGSTYRTILDRNRIYELRADGNEKEAAKVFLESFRILPLTK